MEEEETCFFRFVGGGGGFFDFDFDFLPDFFAVDVDGIGGGGGGGGGGIGICCCGGGATTIFGGSPRCLRRCSINNFAGTPGAFILFFFFCARVCVWYVQVFFFPTVFLFFLPRKVKEKNKKKKCFHVPKMG